MQAAAESSAAMAHALDDPEALLPPIPNTPWATSGKTDPPGEFVCTIIELNSNCHHNSYIIVHYHISMTILIDFETFM